MWYLTAPSCTNQQSMQGSNSKLSARYVHVLYVLGLCLCFFPGHESRCTILLYDPFGFAGLHQELFQSINAYIILQSNPGRIHSRQRFPAKRTSPKLNSCLKLFIWFYITTLLLQHKGAFLRFLKTYYKLVFFNSFQDFPQSVDFHKKY